MVGGRFGFWGRFGVVGGSLGGFGFGGRFGFGRDLGLCGSVG